MELICPECKNEIKIENPQDLKKGTILECNTCGITLEVTGVNDEKVDLEIIDEGK